MKKTNYYIGYTTENNDDKILKTSSNIKTIKYQTLNLLHDESKLKELNATVLYVNTNDENEIFVAFKNDDDKWDVELNNFEFEIEDDYKNILLNRIYYSLTGTFPDNFKITSPDLYNEVLKTDKGTYLQDGDETGVRFENETGDALISINIDRGDDNEKILNWVKNVAKHFNVELIEKKYKYKNSYTIRVKDQMKYFK